jgi:hypothetical protein
MCGFLGAYYLLVVPCSYKGTVGQASGRSEKVVANVDVMAHVGPPHSFD